MSGFGLNALFEAMNATKEAAMENDTLFEAFEDSIDDDIKVMVSGDDTLASMPSDEEEIEMDMAGMGYQDDEMRKLVSMIPEYDANTEEDINSLVESCLPNMDI